MCIRDRDSAFTTLGKYSAVLGLSSPFSALKNLAIGTTNTMGLFGTTNYMRSVMHMLSPESKAARAEMDKLGIAELGSKDLDLTGFSSFVMRRISFMKPSEVANRYTSAWAGLLSAEQLASRLRGEGMFGKMSARRAEKE